MMGKYSSALKWALGYLGVILLFALCYLCLPKDQWGGNEGIQVFGDAFYFSVVTITSLGFGDIYPVAGTAGRFLVATEAILGILIIGFFLNDIAIRQSVRLDKEAKENEERKKRESADARLELYFRALEPVFERYLRGVYEVITPLEERKFPEDYLHHTYTFEFKDLHELYGQSLMMNNEFSEPVVSIHLRDQDVLYQELKEFVTNADLSYWPDLEEAIFHFIQSHHEFQFKQVILNNGLRPMGKDQNLKDMLSNVIKETEGEPEYKKSNLINAYVALYYFLKDNIVTVQSIYGAMEKEVTLR
ncbi:MAG: two pore domain potassium channel family protein [Prevotella sp.]|nr:two pore domain potassium channel family protein [Prevotella sp.]